MGTTFTTEELILALQTAVQGAPSFDPKTFTTSEYAEIANMSHDMALKELKRLATETKLIVPEKSVKRLSFWGFETKVRGWRFIGNEKDLDKFQKGGTLPIA